MAPAADNAAIIEMLRQLREDVARQEAASSESRARTHQRIDELIDRVGHLDTTVALAGQIDAQVRSELDALKQTVAANHAAVSPTVEEWQRILKVSRWLAVAFGLTGASLAALIVATFGWFGEATIHFIRRLLRSE